MNDPRLTGDVDGRAAKFVRLTAPSPGPRFSARAKKLVLVTASVLTGAIVLGILSAGGGNSSTTAVADDHPGMSAPDVLAMTRAARTALPAPSTVTPTPVVPHPTPPVTPTATPGADPAAAYAAWLTEKHYKALQNEVEADQAAHIAQINVHGMTPPRQAGANPIAASSAATPPTGATSAGWELQKALLQKAAAPAEPATSGSQSNDPNRAFQHTEANTASSGGYLAAVVTPPLGETELLAGSIIPAVLVTGIQSDLPGTITAQVRRTVYDSRRPGIVLIPQGARLVGAYNSGVQYGQERLMVVWNELIFPNGATLDLKGMQGTDGQGEAGFTDQVDNHYARIFGSALLISLLGAGAQLSQPQNAGAFNTPTATQQAEAAMAAQMNTTGANLLNKNLNIAPTLTIRPGYEFNILVQRTMLLPAWVP